MQKTVETSLEFIKDEHLISHKIINDNLVTLSAKNEISPGVSTKFGHIFHHLPHGIIHKSATGMGATTCEIKSARNSIIVEPLRVTAYNKSKIPGALFVGTPPASSGISAVSKLEIIEYLGKPGVKKIFCVVDSLPSLMSLIPEQERGEFFLLLDETDSLQLDSSFRSVMHLAMEIYKKHPKEMRATVTATPITFSDPQLASERITVVKYDFQQYEDVEVLNTDNAHESLVNLICEHFETYPDRKLVVALNSVTSILGVIEQILKSPHCRIDSDDIKVLCSVKKRKAVGEEFYHELNSSLLATRLSFITAAYFTGLDLTDKFSLVVVINPLLPSLSLSPDQVKQIAGRARNGLYTATIVYQRRQEYYHEENSFEVLLKTAERLLEGFKCLSRKIDQDPNLKEKKLKTLQGIITTNEVCGRALLFWDKIERTFKIAYLAIDSLIELNRLHKNVFGKADGLNYALEELNYEVGEKFDQLCGDKAFSASDWFETSLRKINEIFDAHSRSPWTFMTPAGESDFEKETIKVYDEYCDLIDPKLLGELICKACAKKNGWRKALKSLRLELFFATYSPDSNFNYGIRKHFPKGGEFSHSELLSKWCQLKSLEPDLDLLMDDPVFLLHRIFANVRSRRKGDSGKMYYVSVTRVIDPGMVKKYKDVVSEHRFDALDYVA